MAEHTNIPSHLDRRSTSDSAADILLSKIRRDSIRTSSALSGNSSVRSMPFLSLPVTPIEPDDVPFRATEGDYFSLSQRRPQRARRKAHKANEDELNATREPEPGSVPDSAILPPLAVRNWTEHNQTSGQRSFLQYLP